MAGAGALSELSGAMAQVWARAAALLRRGEERFGITPAGGILLTVAAASWILARLLGSRAAFLLSYGMLLLLVVAWSTGRRGVAVDAERSEVSRRVVAGRVVEVRVLLTARRRVSNVIIEEVLPPPLGSAVVVPVAELVTGAQASHDYRFVARQRGVYQVGPLVLVRSDPLGLTRRRTVLLGPAELIVHPPTEPAHDRIVTREWEDPPIRPPVSKPWPTGFDFYGMRDYVAGDDPRRIVWRASARTLDPATGRERYLVRESEQGITDRVALVLDTDRRTHSPGAVSETFETAVRVVASLGARHLRDGFSVSLETSSTRLFDGLRGERNRIALLDRLARVERERAELGEAAQRLVSDRRRLNLHTVFVTPDVTPEAAARLRILVDRGASILVALVLWADSDPASLQRVAALGCHVVEVEPDAALADAFGRVVGAGVRREH